MRVIILCFFHFIVISFNEFLLISSKCCVFSGPKWTKKSCQYWRSVLWVFCYFATVSMAILCVFDWQCVFVFNYSSKSMLCDNLQ